MDNDTPLQKLADIANQIVRQQKPAKPLATTPATSEAGISTIADPLVALVNHLTKLMDVVELEVNAISTHSPNDKV